MRVERTASGLKKPIVAIQMGENCETNLGELIKEIKVPTKEIKARTCFDYSVRDNSPLRAVATRDQELRPIYRPAAVCQFQARISKKAVA